MYKIILDKKAEKSLDKIPDQILQKIDNAIQIIKNNPFVFNPKIKKLHKPLSGYRYKIWPYRILYTIDEKKKEISIYKIFHRGKGY